MTEPRRLDDARAEVERMREALQDVMQILGPTAPEHEDGCAGCQHEIHEAIQRMRAAGIRYHSRDGGNDDD